jgi:hypothetical protein
MPVAEATSDFMDDDGFHEIHLSGKQLVFLFMATTVVSVLIFLSGVAVGRGVRAQQPQERTSEAALPVAPAPTPAPPQPVADAGPPAAEPPAPAPEAEELSYKKRLEGEAAAAETLKPQPKPQPQVQPARQAAAQTPPVLPAASQTIAGSPQPGTWVVQVHALRDRTVAAGIVQRLAGKGYPAFLVAAGPPTGAFKVQVGKYRDRSDAEKAVERLKKEEQFNPWITR